MIEEDERMHHQKNNSAHQTVVQIGSVEFGGPDFGMIAGPCAVESYEQLYQVALCLKEAGISCLRAGAFKPRTSPHSDQGMREEGIELLGMIRREMGLAIVSEIMSPDQIAIADPHVDCFQVGSRNMQNFELLKALGQTNKPVLLKRGLAATVEEFLLAAEYILHGGNPRVILCERGIRSFDPATRNVLDLAAVAFLKEKTHLPVIVDPSHATGKRSLVLPVSRAAVVVGADGLIVEAHPNPEKSISDAAQAISMPELSELNEQLMTLAETVRPWKTEPNSIAL